MHKIKQNLVNIWNYLYDPKKTFSYYYKNAWELFLDSLCVFVAFNLLFWYLDLPGDSLKRDIYYNMSGSFTILLFVSIFYLFLSD